MSAFVIRGPVLALSEAARKALGALHGHEEGAEVRQRFEAYAVCELCGTVWLSQYQEDKDIPELMLLGAAERGRVGVGALGRCWDCKNS